MSGGNLNVEITQDGHILTIGDAELVYEGKIDLNGFTNEKNDSKVINLGCRLNFLNPILFQILFNKEI